MTRRLIRVDGTETPILLPMTMKEVANLIGASTLESVDLAHREVMIVDNLGRKHGLPVNAEATFLYEDAHRGSCWLWHGDVVIVPDSDFGPGI